MSTDRRIFIKTLAGGCAGSIILGSCGGSNIQNAEPAIGTVTDTKPVFPFFKYISRYNIGDFIPKDQGGKFVHTEIFGTEEDKMIVEMIRNGRLQEIYGSPIGWSKYEKSQLEKSVWLNRFYFLPSFARMYYLTGDKAYLEDMMQLIAQWIRDNPRQPDSHRKTFNWRDMQVAWRSIHWSWCYYLTEKDLTKQHKELITGSLKEHAEILLDGFGKAPLNEFNHQSHGGLAMLYLGVLFPSLEHSDELKSVGMRILSHHLDKAFNKDGGNVENMFGYYPFETHIFRDMYLLCSENDLKYPANTMSMLEKMATYISVVAQPNGIMPAINDSFDMPAGPILDTVNEILGLRRKVKKGESGYLPDSQLGVMRRGNKDNSWYLLAYPAATIGAHSHAGRLAFNFWVNGHPILTDSGCCNYDNPKLVTWYRTSQAHNTVLIDNKSDEATSSDRLWVAKRETGNRITHWEEKDNYSYCRMVSPDSEPANNSVNWSRSLVLVNDEFLILHDKFDSREEHSYKILFHFPPSDVSKRNERPALLVKGTTPIAIVPANPGRIKNLVLSDGEVSVKGKGMPAPMASFEISGNGSVHSLIVFIPGVEDLSQIRMEQESNDAGTGVVIYRSNSKKTVILLRNPEADKLSLFGRSTKKLVETF